MIKQLIKNIFDLLIKKLNGRQRDFLLSFKRFSFKNRRRPGEVLFIFCVDGSFWNGGLADRFKGLVSVFAYCMINNIKFRVHYTYPFPLTDYLIPNMYDWELKDLDTMSFNIFESRLMNLVGDSSIERLLHLPAGKQIHCFANRDILDAINMHYQTRYSWGYLFKYLFKPTNELQNKINLARQVMGDNFIGIHFRFQNLLGDFNELDSVAIAQEEKEMLITKCRKALQSVMVNYYRQKFMVTSDSITFLNSAKDIPDVVVFDGVITHIDNPDENPATQIDFFKPFLDFFLLSHAEEIYSVVAGDMYPSQFPLYASKINSIPFKRIIID